MSNLDHSVGTASTADLLGQLPVGVMLMDVDGHVVLENDALRALWSGSTHPPGAPFPADAQAADGTAMGAADWPIRRSLATGEALHDVAIDLERPSGDPVSIVADSRPLMDRLGHRIGAVMIVRDVTTARDEATRRAAFVGVLSHELRSPVTSIYSGVELLRGHRLADEVVDDILHDVASEAESLQRLIDDLLVMVRVEGSVAIGVTEPVLLRRIVALAVDDERRRWPGHTFRVDLAPDLPIVVGDEGLIRQVLRNLLSNAAKYGPADGTIVVTGDVQGEHVELRVTDDGPGIAIDQHERVFDLFYRGTTAARIEGSGIGLYVARVLMHSMGGSIRVADRPNGAELALRLPRYRPDVADVRDIAGEGSAD
jgi:signal transduction histidine kinase